MVNLIAIAMAFIIVGTIWLGLVAGEKLAMWANASADRQTLRLEFVTVALGWALMISVPVAVYHNLAPIGFVLFVLSLFSFNIKSSLHVALLK